MNERTLGSRLQNAETIITHLQTFDKYKALRPTEEIAELEALVANIKTSNTDVTTARQEYSTAVEARLQVFTKGVNSIKKLVTPINAAVKATFGKESPEAQQVGTLVKKIQGEKPIIIKEGTTEKKVSQSQKSYGSQTEHFTNIVTILANKGTDYAPANTAISTASLQSMVTGLPQLNFNVTTKYNALTTKRDQRQLLYDDLSQRFQRVKNAVKSQYGIKSSEYTLIKSLRV